MSRQASKQYPGLIERNPFNNEQEAIKYGLTIIGNPVFSNGLVNINSTESQKILFNNKQNVRSIRIKLKDVVSFYMKLSTTRYIQIEAGVISVAGFTSATTYVNGEQSAVIDTDSEIVIMDSVSFYCNDIQLGYNGTSYGTFKADLIDWFNRSLTETEIHNLYHGVEQIDIPKVRGVSELGGLVGVFDGASSIDTGRNVIIRPTIDEFFVEAAVNISSGDIGMIYSYGADVSVSLRQFTMFCFTDGKLFFEIGGVRTITTFTIDDGAWHKIRVNVGLSDADIYIDDVFLQTISIGSYTGFQNGYIGSRTDGVSFLLTGSVSYVNIDNQAIYYLNGNAYNIIDGTEATNNGVTFAKAGFLPEDQAEAIKQKCYQLSTGEIILAPQFELPEGATEYPNGGIYLESLKEKILVDYTSIHGVVENKASTTVPTLTNIVYHKTGTYYSALYNGASSKVDLGYDPIGVGDITIMGWIESKDSETINQILGNGGSSLGSSSKLTLYIYQERLYFRRRADTYVRSDISSVPIHKMIAVFITSKSNGITNIYLGSKESSLILAGNIDDDTGAPEEGTTNLHIGGDIFSSIKSILIPFLRVYQGILPIEYGTQVWSSTLKYLK